MSDYEQEYEDEDVIIIDNGSDTIKAGWLGGVHEVNGQTCPVNETPRAVFPSIIGTPKSRKYMYSYTRNNQQDKPYIGDCAKSYRGILSIKRPADSGFITDWAAMEKIWHHTFYNELRIQPDEHSVIITESAINPKANRERMTMIMFETFNVPSFHPVRQPIMALLGYGETTGLTVNSGHGSTEIAAIYDGYLIQHATRYLGIGGKHIDEYLQRLMGRSFTSSSEKMILSEIKEKSCCVSPKNQELKWDEEADYHELPDGEVIGVGKERFKAPEALFRPKLLGKDTKGIHEHIIDTVEACDIDLRKKLYKNILLSGGNTMIDGFPKRLKDELESNETEISNKKIIKTKIQAASDRNYMAWRGCAIYATTPRFEEGCMSWDDYAESGPGIVHRKCF